MKIYKAIFSFSFSFKFINQNATKMGSTLYGDVITR